MDKRRTFVIKIFKYLLALATLFTICFLAFLYVMMQKGT